ncbi:uncharacterized protein BCR38DRAFT_490926 [Pseudomassariella vexata]|uniref:Uncharacterized protein n=1 Tax=Pseudomassariella vexata TaxID=1141098 RepID=A0A1Y2D9I1_9PEZI|nr:uncharacterized protein BCR38DRAFT_490926 [Pseudomassariella vexata]ORY55919.1 hypothetical protein BCR38DRAFT_490926 [Pseudomassariella vexata]
MCYSMIKSAALAVLSLGFVFSGVNAAPTRNSKDLAVRAGGPDSWKPKPVPAVFDRGFYKSLDTMLSGPVRGNYSDIKAKSAGSTSFDTKVDRINIFKKKNTITLQDGDNDNDPTPVENQQSLSEIMTALFEADTGTKITNLSVIKFDTVVEKDTRAQIDAAYAKLNLDPATASFIVRKDSVVQFSIPKGVAQFDVSPNRVLVVTLE